MLNLQVYFICLFKEMAHLQDLLGTQQLYRSLQKQHLLACNQKRNLMKDK